MRFETEITVILDFERRRGRYIITRIFEGLIPPYEHLIVHPDIRGFVLAKDGDGDLELGSEKHLMPRAKLIYRKACRKDDEYEAIISQMEKDGWKIDEQP